MRRNIADWAIGVLKSGKYKPGKIGHLFNGKDSKVFVCPNGAFMNELDIVFVDSSGFSRGQHWHDLEAILGIKESEHNCIAQAFNSTGSFDYVCKVIESMVDKPKIRKKVSV